MKHLKALLAIYLILSQCIFSFAAFPVSEKAKKRKRFVSKEDPPKKRKNIFANSNSDPSKKRNIFGKPPVKTISIFKKEDHKMAKFAEGFVEGVPILAHIKKCVGSIQLNNPFFEQKKKPLKDLTKVILHQRKLMSGISSYKLKERFNDIPVFHFFSKLYTDYANESLEDFQKKNNEEIENIRNDLDPDVETFQSYVDELKKDIDRSDKILNHLNEEEEGILSIIKETFETEIAMATKSTFGKLVDILKDCVDLESIVTRIGKLLLYMIPIVGHILAIYETLTKIYNMAKFIYKVGKFLCTDDKTEGDYKEFGKAVGEFISSLVSVKKTRLMRKQMKKYKIKKD